MLKIYGEIGKVLAFLNSDHYIKHVAKIMIPLHSIFFFFPS